MIARILPQGHGVAGLLRYLLGPGRKNEHVNPRIVAAWNGVPERLEPPRDDRGRPSVGRLAGLLEQPLALLGDRAPDDPVWHFMARCHPDDPELPDRAWAAITTELMHQLGLSRRGLEHRGVRWVAVCHGDNHVHVVATLARQDGGRARLSKERIIAGQVRRWAETARWTDDPAEREKYRLRAAPRPDRTAARRPTRAETEKARRNKRTEAPRATLRRIVQAAAAGARTEAEFADRLAELGALVKWRTSPATGEVTGYSAGLPGDLTADRPGNPARQLYYSGKTLAPDLTWPKLRARWAGPRLSGHAMTWEAARAILAREVTQAARTAWTEAEFEAALTRAGLLVHWRTGPGPQADRPGPAERTGADRGGPPGGQPGTVRNGPSGRTGADRSARTGYAVSLPGLAGPGGQSRWVAGGQLADGLTLGALRERWAAGRSGAAPGTDGLFDGADRGAIYDYAARVADWAAAQIRSRQPGQASDAAWAAADVLAAAYVATRNPGLRQAAAGFERAARPPWGRVPERTGASDALRTAAWCLYRCQPRHSPGARLLAALARLAGAIAEFRQAQRRLAQAEAARLAATWIKAPGTATAFRPRRPPSPCGERPAARPARRPAAAGACSAPTGRGHPAAGSVTPPGRIFRPPASHGTTGAGSRSPASFVTAAAQRGLRRGGHGTWKRNTLMAEHADVDADRCGAPYCGQPLAPAATGRRPRYCSANCRQAARRARVRAEEADAARAAQLAEARAAASRLWRPMEAAAFHDVPDIAALVLSCASDPDRPRAELSGAISRLDQAAAALARMAREYRDNSDLARQLADS